MGRTCRPELSEEKYQSSQLEVQLSDSILISHRSSSIPSPLIAVIDAKRIDRADRVGRASSVTVRWRIQPGASSYN